MVAIDHHKEKKAAGLIRWLRSNLHRVDRTKVLLLIALSIAGAVYVGHRLVSYQFNHQGWVKSPIQDAVRTCPAPPYPVLANKEKAGKICLTTLTDEKNADFMQRLLRWRNFNNLLQMTWPNKLAYVRKHGYYLFDESDSLDTSRPPSWSKIRAARRLLTEEKCDWVFWMDADTVIMNSSIKIENFLPKESGKDLLLTEQKGGSYNAGAWIIHNTPWALEFLDHWWNMKEFVKPKGLSVSGDNDALKAYTLGMDKAYFDAHIVVPPRCTFNSVATWVKSGEAVSEHAKSFFGSLEHFHKGDFVAHVAGRNNKITTTEMLLKEAA